VASNEQSPFQLAGLPSPAIHGTFEALVSALTVRRARPRCIEAAVGWASKKSNSCSLEPFVSHRACIAKLRAKYFPGM
jgi:hypothetical protein